MFITSVSEVTDELFVAVLRLVPQLGSHKTAPTRDDLKMLVESDSSTLLIARYPDENGAIVGFSNLTVYRVPTGVRSIVEDVVVDEAVRRRGIAKALMKKAIELAREAGASSISLSSNPKREAANLLYQSMGFELRKTNPYSLKLK